MPTFLRALISAVLLIVATSAHGQTWPSRTIKLIVPSGPGLAMDIMGRLLAERLSPALGQTVYVENMPGASGFIGAQAVARAAPDGHTFLFAPASALTSNLFLFKSIPYNPDRDFTPVAMISDRGPFLFSVNPSLPVNTLPELIAHAKANPGKLSYAVDASSGFGLVAAQLMVKRAGIDVVQVPYKSTPQASQDTVSGVTQFMISSVPVVTGLAAEGKLRRIAITTDKPFPGLEDIAPVADVLPGYKVDGWFAILAPAGTPEPIVARMNREIDAIVRQPEMVQRMLRFGLGTSGAGTPQSAAEFIKREQEMWAGLVKELDLKAQ
ncbi:MAG: tripartite tricarboxylate transporter substrate binding protein [Rhizobiales bacterium]|nr:tripartite tricarboxylate transporter substrate binding protein [Hyphomicrobiales bacterium]